jgi:hypothetical protein
MYIQIEVDEHAHSSYPCYEEDCRLEIIAADLGKPGLVLRVDPDSFPLLRKCKRADGETTWIAAQPQFALTLKEIAIFLRSSLLQPPQSGICVRRVSHPSDLAH